LFAGHTGLALLAKAARPRIPLVVLLPVAYAPDIIESMFDLLGQHNRELSHSLVSVGFGATIIALIYLVTLRAKADAFVLWLAYVSHWPADFITGTKPTWPGGPDVGLQFYERPVADAAIECAVVILCWIIYRRAMLRTQTPAAAQRMTTVLAPIGLILAQIVFDYVQHRLIT
jgi:membrane-bound metal-dependent hydrolase YbcI (DUF457 family)